MSNFLNKTEDAADTAKQLSKLHEGYVLSTSETDSTLSEHSLKVTTPTGGQVDAEVKRDTKGDFYLPPPGSIVTVGYFTDDTPVVLGVHDVDTDVDNIDAGERRIGHGISYSHILFEESGDITIEHSDGNSITITESDISLSLDDGTDLKIADGSLIINDGSDSVVTDISTSTNSDGEITSVTPEYSDRIQL